MEIRWVIEREKDAVWLSAMLTIRERQSTIQRRFLSTKSGWTELEIRELALHLNEREEMATNFINTLSHMQTLSDFLGFSLKHAKKTSLMTQMEKRGIEAAKAWDAIAKYPPLRPSVPKTCGEP